MAWFSRKKKKVRKKPPVLEPVGVPVAQPGVVAVQPQGVMPAVQAAPIALFFINLLTSHLPETNEIKIHLINSAPYFRFLMIGIGLLVIMRFRPQGILPEKIIKN